MLTFNISDAHIGLNGAQVQAEDWAGAAADVRASYEAASYEADTVMGSYCFKIYDDSAVLRWGDFNVTLTRKWPVTEATFGHDDVEYDITLVEDGSISITIDGVWAGDGAWDGTNIVDCAAQLGEKVYDGLESVLGDAVG